MIFISRATKVERKIGFYNLFCWRFTLSERLRSQKEVPISISKGVIDVGVKQKKVIQQVRRTTPAY